MKNNLATRETSAAKKWRNFALVALLIFSSVIGVLFFLKATDHRSELRNALASQDNPRLEQLLKTHPGLVNAKLTNRGAKDLWEPLHMAAYSGNTNAIEILLKYKAKVNVRDDNGLTPLHYSVARGGYESAQLLINKGADMNAKGRDGHTPIELAKNLRDLRMIELFRIRGAKE
ncbi:MAG: ankyrin repeat domain-containing protein [Verrucomicrobiota bacterium]